MKSFIEQEESFLTSSMLPIIAIVFIIMPIIPKLPQIKTTDKKLL